jgi:predicted nucleotidyltransferase
MRKQDTLNKISHAIHSKAPDAKVFLFGSRARGTNRKNSDWDILVLVDTNKITNEIEDTFRTELYNIELELGQSISIFIYPKNYWESELQFSPLYKSVLKEGLVLS